MALESLEDLFENDLKDLYSAENQILKALPKMVKAAHSTQLREALGQHLEQTRGHVQRLEEVFASRGMRARAKKCKGMEGILDEGKQVLTMEAEPGTSDAALIGAAQKVEHYEMAAYGTVRTYAQEMGLQDAANLLQQTLDEEGEANKRLTALAEGGINQAAKQAAAVAHRRMGREVGTVENEYHPERTTEGKM